LRHGETFLLDISSYPSGENVPIRPNYPCRSLSIFGDKLIFSRQL
jgi:hypothetical protein